jgi:hypothetical protein
MLATEGTGAPQRVRERVDPVFVQRVETTPGPARGGGDVLVFPPPVDETERGEPAQ